jgi:hypothetical protein
VTVPSVQFNRIFRPDRRCLGSGRRHGRGCISRVFCDQYFFLTGICRLQSRCSRNRWFSPGRRDVPGGCDALAVNRYALHHGGGRSCERVYKPDRRKPDARQRQYGDYRGDCDAKRRLQREGRLVPCCEWTSSTSLTGCYSIAPLLVDSISTTQLKMGTGAACNSALPAYRGQFRVLSHRALVSGDMQGQRRGVPAKAVYMSLLLFGCLAGRRRKWRSSLLLVILLLPVAGATLIGCSGGGNNSSTSTTTTPSSPSGGTTNYTVTLTGADSVNGQITASTTFTLSVN